MATAVSAARREETFYQRMMIGLSLFIMFGFLQFAARGFVDYRTVPIAFHVHAALMTTWLALLVAQSTLASRGDLALHRKLGWTGAGLVVVIVGAALWAVTSAIAVGFVPPFFTPPYFLALVSIGVLIFAGTVAYAIHRRRQTDWHRRLILGSTILIMEPALGRLLPMPLLGDWGEWIIMLVQLGVLGLLVRHDRAFLGRIHPATVASGIVIVLGHVLVTLAAMTPPFARMAAALVA